MEGKDNLQRYNAYMINLILPHPRAAAKNTAFLKGNGITHVLNTAEGASNTTVDTNQENSSKKIRI